MGRSKDEAPERVGPGGARKVVVHGQGVRVERSDADLPLAEARSRFGGVDGWAIAAGLAAALGTLAALSTLLAAAGVAGGGQTDRQTLSVLGLLGGLIALAVSLLFGGYVAGRVARYSGVLNGLLTGALFVLLTALLSALAASAGERSLGLPQWLDGDTATAAAVVTGLVALAVALGAATLGGRLGSRWHRQVDATLIGTRPGGLAPYPTEPALAAPAPAPVSAAAPKPTRSTSRTSTAAAPRTPRKKRP